MRSLHLPLLLVASLALTVHCKSFEFFPVVGAGGAAVPAPVRAARPPGTRPQSREHNFRPEETNEVEPEERQVVNLNRGRTRVSSPARAPARASPAIPARSRPAVPARSRPAVPARPPPAIPARSRPAVPARARPAVPARAATTQVSVHFDLG